MRRAIPALSRLNAARLIAAFIVFCSVAVPRAEAKSPPGTGLGGDPSALQNAAERDSAVAYAVPRNAPPDAEVVLPQPLPPSAVAQVGRVLALQAAGKFAAADALIGRVDDDTLLGPILADRYLSPGYRSSSAELLSWYEQYNNQPEAGAIYALLRRKLPPGAALPAMPPQAALLPDAVISAPAARPRGAPDNPGWRRAFLSGVSAWRRGDVAAAGPIFVRTAVMRHISAEERAGSDFWAARAALRLQQPGNYFEWLQLAAGRTGTFYGMLAGRLLDGGLAPDGAAATLSEADITAVDALPDGHLAFALLQVGQRAAAATALRALWPDMQNSPGLARAVMAVAARAGLVDVAIAVSGALPQSNEFAGMALPMPALHPAGGFIIDPPLVYALARTESGFDAGATSPCGAHGLMQLMPATASAMRRAAGVSGAGGDPAANLALGQAYIRYLGAQSGIDDNLLAILASYNAGPGAAAVWYDALRQDSDPLVFIETIPNDQTRHFVRQVLADSWLYAREIGSEPASLDQLAQGQFPRLGLQRNADAAN